MPSFSNYQTSIINVVHKQKEITHLIIINPYQEKKWCIAPVYNFVIPMLNKWTLHSKLAGISNSNAEKQLIYQLHHQVK